MMKQWVEVRVCDYLYQVPDILEEFYAGMKSSMKDSRYSIGMNIINAVEDDQVSYNNYLIIFTITKE